MEAGASWACMTTLSTVNAPMVTPDSTVNKVWDGGRGFGVPTAAVCSHSFCLLSDSTLTFVHIHAHTHITHTHTHTHTNTQMHTHTHSLGDLWEVFVPE